MADIRFQDSDDEWSDLGLRWPPTRIEILIPTFLILAVIIGLAATLVGR